SRTTAPARGNTSSSHAARCTPAAARGTSVGTAAARAATAARVPVTPTPLCRPRGTTPGAPVSILEQVRVVHRRGPAGTEDRQQDHGERHVVCGAHDRPPFCPFPLASSPAEYAGCPTPVGPGWGGLSDWSAPSGPAGSAPDASRRASLTASRAPGRPETTGLT